MDDIDCRLSLKVGYGWKAMLWRYDGDWLPVLMVAEPARRLWEDESEGAGEGGWKRAAWDATKFCASPP